MPDTSAGRSPRRPFPRIRGGLVTVSTVVALLAGVGLTVLGLGAADQAVASYDAASWVWSRAKGEVARINGVTARVDTRVDVARAQGHEMTISQNDRFVLLRDASTGQIGSLDLTTLGTAGTTQRASGIGVTVALHDDAAFVVEQVQGVVQQVDPRSLSPVGQPVRFPPGIAGGHFDGEGVLWVAVSSEGTVAAITPAPLATPGAAPASARQVRTVAVAAAQHDLALSTLDRGVAVLNRTTQEVTIIRGDARAVHTLTTAARTTVPVRTAGGLVPVTVAESRQVHVVGDGGVRQLTVPGTGAGLEPAVAWQGRIYCPDTATGLVHVFDAAGNPLPPVDVKGAGPLELEVRENYLFINAPDSANARVVDDRHEVRPVDKYADKVLGGDPPPKPPAPPPPPPKPQVSKPGAPKSVTATAGNAQARVSWDAAPSNGAAITRYVVEGAGRTWQVGANQRSMDVTGLTNGEEYRFSVHAENSAGAGPARESNPVRPTAEVPDAPASVTAEARADGTVAVRWPAANGQGRAISKYIVTGISAAGSGPVGDATGTELVVNAGELTYGSQYAFTVVAVNERGASSKPSPVSGSVVPFTKPGRPEDVDAATVGDKAGTITVTWKAAKDNGRAITKYVVQGGGRTVEVTNGMRAEMSQFGAGQNVTVQVRAVNEAGAGEAATATARTVAPPAVTVQRWDSTRTSISTSMSVDAGGGTATCTMDVAGRGSASGPCSKLEVGGLLPATGYTVKVTPKNAAGDGPPATRTVETDAVWGVAVCETTSKDPKIKRWCEDDRNGREIFSGTTQNSTRLGRAENRQRLAAVCKATGDGMNDYIYNPGKMGTSENDRTYIWIRVKWGNGTGYMSFAWFNVEGVGVNETDPLPNC